MNKEKFVFGIKDICLIAILSCVLFIQEEILTFLPNIQLTIFLMVLYSKKVGFRRTIIIIVIYFLLDCVVMGSLNPLFISFQLIGWLFIPFFTCLVFKKIENNIVLAFLGILYSLLYSWIMIFPNMIIYEINFVSYLLADLVFEGLLAGSSFLSILLLYNPMSNVLEKLLVRYYKKEN